MDEKQALDSEYYPWKGEKSHVSENGLVDFFPAILILVPSHQLPAAHNKQLRFLIYHQYYIGRVDPSRGLQGTIIALVKSMLLWSRGAWRLERAGGERSFSETETVWHETK